MPAVLKQAGYRTALIGKWHLGYDYKFHPMNYGFDEFRGFVGGNVDYHTHVAGYGTQQLDWWNDRKIENEEGYSTDLLTKYAIDFICAEQRCPVLPLPVARAPHVPLQGREPSKKGVISALRIIPRESGVGKGMEGKGIAGGGSVSFHCSPRVIRFAHPFLCHQIGFCSPLSVGNVDHPTPTRTTKCGTATSHAPRRSSPVDTSQGDDPAFLDESVGAVIKELRNHRSRIEHARDLLFGQRPAAPRGFAANGDLRGKKRQLL